MLSYRDRAEFLLRRNLFLMPWGGGRGLLASGLTEMAGLGYVLDRKSLAGLDDCRETVAVDLESRWQDLLVVARERRGANYSYRTFYPEFPRQVMGMQDADLYLRAAIHYANHYDRLPGMAALDALLAELDLQAVGREAKLAIQHLADVVQPTVLRLSCLANETDLESVVTSLVRSSVPLQEADKAFVRKFMRDPLYRDWTVAGVRRGQFPCRETLAIAFVGCGPDRLAGLQLEWRPSLTDVLRIAAEASGGDPSFRAKTRYRLPRAWRRVIVTLLMSLESEDRDVLSHDLAAHREEWKRVLRTLHAGEFVAAPGGKNPLQWFYDLVESARSWSSELERLLSGAGQFDVQECCSLASRNPGQFVRSLTRLLESGESDLTLHGALLPVIDRVSSRVLLQASCELHRRGEIASLSAVRPAQGVEFVARERLGRPASYLARYLDSVLAVRFASRSPLGRVWIDPALRTYAIQQDRGTAGTGDLPYGRWTQFPLSSDCKILRMFCWWQDGTAKDPSQRVDVDLSAGWLKVDPLTGELIDSGACAYYHLRSRAASGEFAFVHSGDLVSAPRPRGAAEFIDVNLDLASRQATHIVLRTNIYYGAARFSDLDGAFAGWQEIQSHQEPAFDPRAVRQRIMLASPCRLAAAMLLDLRTRMVTWLDVSLASGGGFGAARDAGPFHKLVLACRDRECQPASLYRLLELHAYARGHRVSRPEEADLVMDLDFLHQRADELLSSEWL